MNCEVCGHLEDSAEHALFECPFGGGGMEGK